ncbi:hypothetical protein EJD97_005712 [Solanum chilense]|uniref:EF-hand domain-containing protein n=1 Tax=Solanum chilense TaxID=4083 RepID=A0A6N2BQJ3_SOLCI|nr:hypothetical protein EJD97_005712 [Solanum chilense]
MENIFSISAISASLLGKKIADDLNQFFCIILRCTILSILSTFQDLSYCFSLSIRAIGWFFIILRNALTRVDHDYNPPDAKNCGHDYENCDNKEEIVEDKLMSLCNLNENETEYAEVSSLFDEVEPSFEEIKEAFDVFDENGDGYIDASELMKLIWRMGLSQFSMEDCKKMIMAFDENRDGKIEFSEFLKLMEQSFRDLVELD